MTTQCLLAAPTARQQRAFVTATPQRSSRTRLVMAAGKGFDGGSVTGKKKVPKLARLLADEDPQLAAKAQQASAANEEGWSEVPDIDASTSFLSKPIKPVIFPTGKAVCVYKAGDTIYCSDANSTAFQYPLADANLLQLKSGPAVESPFDGTVYDLASGKVLSWCPKNTLGRKILGSLKDKTRPVDLPVYPVRIQKDGRVFVKLRA